MRASPLRRPYVLAALLGSALFTLSCGGDSGTPSPTPTNVVVTPGADTLVSVGETRTFTAAVLDANGDPIDGKTVTWSSTAPGVLTIDATSGVATAIANGTAQVHATSGSLQGSASVFVAQIVASVTVTPGNVAFTAVGDTARFSAVAKDAGGTPVIGVQVLWSVSDNAVATIDTLGLAKSKGPGSALVSAQAQTRAGYAAIGVAPGVASLVILGAPTTAVAGEPMTTALQVELQDANGNRVMNASLPVTVFAAEDAGFNSLHGTTTLITDQGRTSFTGLWFEHTDHDRIMVTAGALPVVYSTTVAIAPGPPAQVRLESVSQTQTAGVPIGLVARVRDRLGNLATNFQGTAQAELAESPGGGGLFGGYIILADSGVATFSTLNFHLAAAPWRVTVYLPGIATPRDTTIPMVVQPADPAAFSIQHLGAIRVGFGFGIDSTVVRVTDAFGNLVPGDGLEVQLSTTGWAFSSPPAYVQQPVGEFSALVSGGDADFHIGLLRPGRTRLIFSVPGLLPDTSDEVIPTLPIQELFGASGTFQPPVMVGDRFTCIGGGVVYCAGANDHGILGVDSVTIPSDSLYIHPDSELGGIGASADGGDRHACQDVFGGTFYVVCWGDNSEGQLGSGSVGGESNIPIVVAGTTAGTAIEVAAGGAHSCADIDGTVKCWGKNDVGQLGIGAAGASTGTATDVAGGHTFTQIVAGGRHSCGIDDANHLWCWGANEFGQLGDSGVSGAFSATPISVRPSVTWSGVSAGDDFTCGATNVASQLLVYCWGRNDRLQLGPDHTADSASSVPVLAQTFFGASNGVMAGAAFVCVGTPEQGQGQRVQCWGANDHAQLGRGTTSSAESGAAPPLPSDATADIQFVIAGRTNACGLTYEVTRRLVCWGDNSHGQFGTGHTSGDVTTPVVIQDQY